MIDWIYFANIFYILNSSGITQFLNLLISFYLKNFKINSNFFGILNKFLIFYRGLKCRIDGIYFANIFYILNSSGITQFLINSQISLFLKKIFKN